MQHFPDRTIRMQEQSFCLLNTQALHGISVDSPDDIVFSLIISKSLFNRLIASMTPHDSLLMSFFLESAFASNEGSYIMFDPKQGSQARYFARGFLLEYYRKMPGAPQAMMSLFMLLLIELMRTSNYFVADNGREGIQINSILAFIDAHLSDVSLDSCSTHFGYSKGHLSRSIKRMTGTSFASLVGQMRLARAEELLTTTEETVENIALSLGYYDKSHFNRAFKAHKGMSPNEFRKHQ